MGFTIPDLSHNNEINEIKERNEINEINGINEISERTFLIFHLFYKQMNDSGRRWSIKRIDFALVL